MKYQCVAADIYELWLTEGKVYDAEPVITPREFSGGGWLHIIKADDGYECYSRSVQFKPYVEK